MQRDIFEDKQYLALIEDMRDEHNKLRQNPRSFIPALQDRLYRMKDGKIIVRTGVKLVTKEGEAAIKEAIEYLEEAEPITQSLKACKALCKSAQGHADDTGPKGMTGHYGSNGSEMTERIDQYVEYAEWKGENCNYSEFNKARDIVIDLLIDDGQADRSHRRNLFEPNFICLGVGMAEHSKYRKAVVINYASDVTPIDPEDGYMSFPDDQEYVEVENKLAGETNPGMAFEAKKERHRKEDTFRGSWLCRILGCHGNKKNVSEPTNYGGMTDHKGPPV